MNGGFERMSNGRGQHEHAAQGNSRLRAIANEFATLRLLTRHH